MITTIDFHSHILPAVDDGAPTVDVSCSMLESLHKQGVNTVVLTPHYYSTREPIDAFIERRAAALQNLQANAPKQIALKYGAEVYFSEYLFNNADLSPLLINGTRTMLIELPFSKSVDKQTVRHIDRLVCEYDITPVLAHIERYPSLLRSRRTMEELMDIGCVFQVNVSSFTARGKRKLLSLAKDGWIGALGTDSHNMNSRAPIYTEGYAVLEKCVKQDGLEYMQHVMKSLLK